MSRRREILLGLVIVLGAAVTVLGTLFLKGSQLRRETIVVEALSASAGQLGEGNVVKLRGVEVGRVESISVEPDGEAVRIELRIQRSLTLPADAGVVFLPESMFGDWQAEIVSRGRFPRYEFFSRVTVEELPGFALPDLSRLTAAADQIAENLTVITDRIDLAFTEETAINLREAIDNFQRVSAELDRLVTQQAESFEGVASEVESSAEELGAAAEAARRTFERLQGVMDAAEVDLLAAEGREAVRNLYAVSERLGTVTDNFNNSMVRADSTLARFERIGAAVEGGQGTLGRLVYDSAFALESEELLSQLTLLLQDIRENPSRYVRLSIF